MWLTMFLPWWLRTHPSGVLSGYLPARAEWAGAPILGASYNQPNPLSQTWILSWITIWARYQHEIYFLRPTNMSVNVVDTLKWKKESHKTQLTSSCRRLVWLHLEGTQNRLNFEYPYLRRDSSTARDSKVKYSGEYNQYMYSGETFESVTGLCRNSMANRVDRGGVSVLDISGGRTLLSSRESRWGKMWA